MSGLTSLSWAPNTSFLHAIQAISSTPRQVLLQPGNPFPLSGIKIEFFFFFLGGGIWPDVFSLLFPPSLKTATIPGRLAYTCFFCSWGWEPGVPVHSQRVRRGLSSALLLAIGSPRVLVRERGID